MAGREKINQYDVIEVIDVPEKLRGVIEIGDIGTVVEKYDDRNFEVECILPGGGTKWLATLPIKYIRLKTKDPYDRWIKTSLLKPMMQKSILFGAVLGAIAGGLIGAGFGAIAFTLPAILIGLGLGSVSGLVTGALTAALTVKTAGTTGGVSVGAYTGMLFGGAFGMLIGVLIPTSVRMSAHTEGIPVLDALAMGRFETAILTSFLLSILATIVGAWIGGKNLAPRNLQKE
jgi:hypothetical protein